MFYVGNIKWKIKTYLIHFCLIDNVWPVSWSQDLHIVITFHEKWLDPRKIAILIFLLGCLNSLLPEFQNLLIITMQMTTHLSSVYFFQIVAGPSIYVAHQELYTIWIKRIMFIKFILKSVLFFCYTSQSYSLLIFILLSWSCSIPRLFLNQIEIMVQILIIHLSSPFYFNYNFLCTLHAYSLLACFVNQVCLSYCSL